MTGELRAFLEDMLGRPPFHRWLGPVLEEVDEAAGALTVRIPARPELARWPDGPGFHGGIVAAAIDIAAHAAVSMRTRRPVPTVDLRADYLRASTGADLRAHARIVRAGRRLATARVEAAEPGGRLIAHGMATFHLDPG